MSEIQSVAHGVFFPFVPAMLDIRGKLAAKAMEVLDDPNADVALSIMGTGGGILPEEVVATSRTKGCSLAVSPVKVLLTAKRRTTPGEFAPFVTRMQTSFADILAGTAIGFIGSVVRTQADISKTKAAGDPGTLIAPPAFGFPKTSEARYTVETGDYKQLIVLKPLTPGTIEVSMDAQKVLNPAWTDIPSLLSKAQEFLNVLVTSLRGTA